MLGLMLTAERHRAILRLLEENGRITVAEITRRFQVSASTARRDAVLLAKSGQAFRSHGGLLPAKFFEEEPGLRGPNGHANGTEASIARRAVELVPHEGAVFVDSGSTCLEVGRLLVERRNLRLFTNSVPLIALAAESQATITSIAGEMNKESKAFFGPLALTWLARLRFDVAILGAAGLERSGGALATCTGDAAIKAEVMRRSDSCVLVTEAAKWNGPAPIRFARWSEFDAIVTDHALPRDARIALAAEKVKVVLA